MKLKFHNAALNPPTRDGTYLCYSDFCKEFYVAEASVFVTGGIDWSYKPSFELVSSHSLLFMDAATDIIKSRMGGKFSKTQEEAIKWAMDEIKYIIDFEHDGLYRPFEVDDPAPDPDYYCKVEQDLLFNDFLELDEFEVHSESLSIADDISEAVFSVISRLQKSRDLAASQPWKA